MYLFNILCLDIIRKHIFNVFVKELNRLLQTKLINKKSES